MSILTIFQNTCLHPSLGSTHSLLEIRKQGLIPGKNFIVVCLFHEKQLEYDNLGRNYKAAMIYVRKNHLDWIKFHKITGDFYS